MPRRLSEFALRLRERGLAVGPNEVMQAMEALDALGLRERDSLYWALRLAMVARRPDVEVFDELFATFWKTPVPFQESVRADAAGAPPAEATPKSASDQEDSGRNSVATRQRDTSGTIDGDADAEPDALRGAYSDFEVLRQKDFADYTADDYARLHAMLNELRLAGPWRRSRRMAPARTGDIDLMRTVRASFQTQGHPVRRHYRERQLTRRRLALVCDVSGSMESYSYALLHLAQAWLLAQRRVEVFVFATRLTRITPELMSHEGAVRAAMASVVDWSGGTRIGACLTDLTRFHRREIQGAVVVIASDGWDRGDPGLLAQEAAYLHRIAHAVIWVNPHLHTPQFEPLTRGMAAVLPHIDDFLPCHNFDSFGGLVDLVTRL